MGIGTRKMSQEDLQGKERAGKSYVWQHFDDGILGTTCGRPVS